MLKFCRINDFLSDDSGATAIEYGLIAALIAVALVSGASALGDQLNASFDATAGELDAASKSGLANTAQNGID